MGKETKQILGLILDKLDNMDNKLESIDSRLDNVKDRLTNVEYRLTGVENRLTNVETELKDFRLEMKEEIKGLDGKVDLIYNKLNSDIKSRYTVVKENE